MATVHLTAEATWAGRGGLRRAHTATGQFTLEDFVEYLIDQVGVRPRHERWRSVLARNRGRRTS